MSWDPAQYLAFEDQRLRPAMDLLARVGLLAPASVVDLGCGAGNVTRLLRARWPEAEITGVDGSAEMLDRAREAMDDVTWREADVANWRPERPVELLYSNALLQWLGDHAGLFPALASAVAPGGVMAVQMPQNFRAPSHTSVHAAARQGPWAATLEPLLQDSPVHEPGFYYDVLSPLARRLDIFEIEYLQILAGENPVAEFTKGSWLKPYLDALEEPEKSDFEAAYRALVKAAYPARADGKTLFPFRRLFIVASF